MPELKRNFMKGRMNKDLDERLISDGEYRDALNIQVSTAEGSDVGSARNISSNKGLGLLTFKVPYKKKSTPGFNGNANDRGGITDDSGFLSSASTSTISSSAEVVGAIKSESENRIYSLIANATDLTSRPSSVKTTNEDVASGSGTTYVLDSDISASVDVGDIVVGTGTTDVLQETTVVSIVGTTVVLSKSHTTLADGDTLQFHTPVNTGRKSDLILQYTPDSFVTGTADSQPVFVDVYEVRADWGNTLGDALHDNFVIGYQAHSADLLEDVIYEHTSLSTLSVANGIEVGMQVDAIDVNGDSLWDGTYNGVFVTNVDIDGASTSGGGLLAIGVPPDFTRLTLELSKKVILTDAQVKAGAVLKFTKEKILNFQTGTSYSYSDKRLPSQTVSSYTPEGTKITGLDIIDNMLFLAADNDEPKKINIDKGIQGSKFYFGSGSTHPNIFQTTNYIYESDVDGGNDVVSVREVMVKDDVTVCKLGPLTAPKLWMRDTSRVDNLDRDAVVNAIGLAGVEPLDYTEFFNGVANQTPGGLIPSDEAATGYDFFQGATELDLSAEEATHELFVDPFGGGNPSGSSFSDYADAISSKFPYYDIGDNTKSGWRSGDRLDLYNGNYGYHLKVEVGDDIQSTTKLNEFGETRDVVKSLKVKILDANDHYRKAAAGLTYAPRSVKWIAYLNENAGTGEPSALYREKFVRFAYRYRYNDGEISPISPFSLPAWIPAAPYVYNSLSEGNMAMFNGLKWLAITDFIGGNRIQQGSFNHRRGSNRPVDLKSIDLLYKEDGNSNVYLLKNIDKSSAIDGNLNHTINPSSNWDHNGFLGGENQLALSSSSFKNSSKRGFYKIPGDQSGRVIPNMQVFRPFDDVPRNVKSQCVSSSRIIYGNYKTQYDLTDDNGEKILLDYNIVDGVVSDEVRPLYGYTHGLSVHENIHHTFKGFPYTSLKRDREYSVGVVFKDRFGRESSVVLGKQNTINLGKGAHRSGVSALKISLQPNGTYPSWAEYYKYFIKESSNEYYNLPVWAAYPASYTSEMINGVAEDEVWKEVWIIFDSKDRNKIQEDSTLIMSKAYYHYTAGGGSNTVEYPVIGISNEVPNPKTLPDGEEHPNPELPAEVEIDVEDKKGKFFVRLRVDKHLHKAFGKPTGPGKKGAFTGNTMIFQTKPDPVSADLNIFYEASDNRPISLWDGNIEDYINIGDKVTGVWWGPAGGGYNGSVQNLPFEGVGGSGYGDYNTIDCRIVAIKGSESKDQTFSRILLSKGILAGYNDWGSFATNGYFRIHKPDNSIVQVKMHFHANSFSGSTAPFLPGSSATTMNTLLNQDSIDMDGDDNSLFEIKNNTWGTGTVLGWYNCFAMQNGVEANRVGDRFNAITIDKGVKVSAPSPNYQEQERKHSLTFSGLYNSKNGVNNLNQFIAAEGITKDLNPEYGSIQKLFSRNTDAIAFCEDKVLKILSSKDALFNADGNTSITATNRVLGQAIPFSGEHGISKNPESFAANEYRCYFTDRARGSVLRLSRDGITKISDIGMKNHFADTLKSAVAIIGSFNSRKSEYDITIHSEINTTASTKSVNTVSFNEDTNGWVSFRAYALEQGLSLNNTYYTFRGGELYEHGEDPGSAARNNFYGIQYYSSITPVFNDMPSSVKSFNLINYEGSQARVIQINDDDANAVRTPDQNYQQYYNNVARTGWYVDSIITDQQTGKTLEFKEKEGKWFNKVQGEQTTWTNTLGGLAGSGSGNLDSQEFSFQGIGLASGISNSNIITGDVYTITATASCASSNAPTITGDADVIITGGNINTLTSTITVTAATGFVLGDLNISSFPTTNSITPTHLTYLGTNYDASTDIPSAGQTSITLTVVWPSATVSASGTWTIPFTMASQAKIDHLLVLILEYQNSTDSSGYQGGLTEQYYFTNPSSSNASYTVGQSSDVTSTVDATYGEAVFSIQAIDLNPTLGSQEIASFSVVANDGSTFSVANNSSLSTLYTTDINAGLATTQSKLVFNSFQDATSGTTNLELSSDDNEYNVTTTPSYDADGLITNIVVKIFYNPLASTAGYTNADTLRIPYLGIVSPQLQVVQEPITYKKFNFHVEVQDLNSPTNTYGINPTYSVPPAGGDLAVGVEVHVDGNDSFIMGTNGIYMGYPGELSTASADDIADTSFSGSQTLGDVIPDGFSQIFIKPDPGKFINVSKITSWLGFAHNTNAETTDGYYYNEIFANGVDGLAFSSQTSADNMGSDVETTLFADNIMTLNNTVSNIPLSNLVTKIHFQDTHSGADLITGVNNVIMNIAWNTSATLAGTGGLLPGGPAQLANIISAGEVPIGVVPLPIISDHNTDSSLTSAGKNHRFQLHLDEIMYLDTKPPATSSSLYTPSSNNNFIGYQLTQTEQTNYDAYDSVVTEPATLGGNATLTAQTLATVNATGAWTNTSFGSRGVSGDFVQLTVEGTYSSGDTAVHVVKYDINSVQVDTTDLEFVFWDSSSNTATSIVNDAALQAVVFLNSSVADEMFSGLSTQLGSYSITAAGTYSGSKCTAIEFTFKFNSSGEITFTDSDYNTDPLTFMPSKPRYSALGLRKQLS